MSAPYAPHADFARFGAPDGDPAAFRKRVAAYGLLASAQGRLAIVRISQDGRIWFDLPGGAVEAGETEMQALAREFREETGLEVEPGPEIARAEHYWVNPKTEAVLNKAVYAAVAETGSCGAPQEPDHELVWLEPLDAIERMRHDAAAWAIARWLRAGAVCGA